MQAIRAFFCEALDYKQRRKLKAAVAAAIV